MQQLPWKTQIVAIISDGEQRSAVYCSCSGARRASEDVRSMCLASLASEIADVTAKEDMRLDGMPVNMIRYNACKYM